MRMTADVAGIVEHDPFGRRVHPGPHRLVAVTHAAAGEDRIVRRLDVDPIGARSDVRGSGARQPCHGHHGLPLPSCRELKKWRMTGPIASTIATISQLKRVANING